MMIHTTPRELFDKGLWSEYCSITGFNPWAVSEGMDDKTEILLSFEDAQEIGLL